jgi:hypothetical protein
VAGSLDPLEVEARLAGNLACDSLWPDDLRSPPSGRREPLPPSSGSWRQGSSQVTSNLSIRNLGLASRETEGAPSVLVH